MAQDSAIGGFTIGVSPIGSIPQFDVWETVISQYANSPRLMQLILNLEAYLDPTESLDLFYDRIWNVLTAEDYGLDVWGRIVGVNRILQVEVSSWFGFAEALPGSEPWGQGSFYSGEPLTQNYRLSDESYRQLILAKAAANITNCSIPALNQILLSLFPHRGNCYVTEGGVTNDWFGFAEAINSQGWNQAPFYSGQSIPRMVMTYTFDFELSPVELAIVQNSGVLPKPVGVASSVVLLQG